jgi:hypothetical protein
MGRGVEGCLLRRPKGSMGRGVEKGYTASRKGVNGQEC